MSLKRTEVAPADVTVTVPPSVTVTVSETPIGRSLSEFTVTRNSLGTSDPHPESFAKIVIVAVPVASDA